MNVALRKPMTLEQFLAWEDRKEPRYEFDGFQPVAMSDSTAARSAIQVNLIAALVPPLRGTPFRPFGSTLKILVAGCIRYPAAFVVCAPIPPTMKVIVDPVVVFEVLSDGSEHTDMVEKNAEYRATPSIQRYVILQRTHAGATVFHRKGEDWVTDFVVGMDGVLPLPEIVIDIPMAELYADVALQSGPDSEPVAG